MRYFSEQMISKINPSKDNYYIILNENGDDYLEIISKRMIKDDNCFVVGRTATYEEALEFVSELVQKTFNETGDADLKKYILSKQQE